MHWKDQLNARLIWMSCKTFVILLKKKNGCWRLLTHSWWTKYDENASNIQMELIDFKTNSILNTKFDELISVPGASDMINFLQSLPGENLPELQKFAQGYICRFGTTYTCEQAFSSMKLIESKTRSCLTDLNLKTSPLLSICHLAPNQTLKNWWNQNKLRSLSK